MSVAASSAPSPDNLEWLRERLDASPLLPDERLRALWRLLLPHLGTDARYELAATLLEAERAV